LKEMWARICRFVKKYHGKETVAVGTPGSKSQKKKTKTGERGGNAKKPKSAREGRFVFLEKRTLRGQGLAQPGAGDKPH